MALGSPGWVTGVSAQPDAPRNNWEGPLCSLSWRSDVRTAEAVKTHVGDVGRSYRDAQTFKGVSGGRTQVVEMLGKTRLDYAKSVVDNAALFEMLREDVTEGLERPGQGVLPSVADRLAVTARGADFPLLEWTPEPPKVLENPDEKLSTSELVGPFP